MRRIERRAPISNSRYIQAVLLQGKKLLHPEANVFSQSAIKKIQPTFPLTAPKALVGLGLWVLLFSIYLVNYSGILRSGDEISMFAVTETLVKQGRFSIDQINWVQSLGAFGAFGSSGHLYSKYGPAQSLLAAPLYLLSLTSDHLGAVQLVTLLDPILTAFTGVLVFFIVAELGYSLLVGALASLLYGTATMALVYSKYFYSEPLTASALAATFLALLCQRRRTEKNQRWLLALLAGLLVALALATKVTNIIALPFFLGYLLSDSPFWGWFQAVSGLKSQSPEEKRYDSRRREDWRMPLVAFSAPLALGGLLLLGYNKLRFGGWLISGYGTETFSTPLWKGLAGLLISPGKSIFIYSPPLLLVLWAWPRFHRSHRTESLLIGALTITYLGVYSCWAQWWGGANWGPRYILPLLPLLVILLAPLLADRAWLQRFWPLYTLLVMLGWAVQVTGSIVDPNRYLDALTIGLLKLPSSTGDPPYTLSIWNWHYWPLTGQWLMAHPANWDMAWVQNILHNSNSYDPRILDVFTNWATNRHSQEVIVQWQPLGLSIGICFISLVAVVLFLRLPAHHSRFSWLFYWFLLPLSLLVGILQIGTYHSDSRYNIDRGDFTALRSYLHDRLQPGDRAILVAQGHMPLLFNDGKRDLPPYINIPRLGEPLSTTAITLLQRQLTSSPRLWLIIEWSDYNDPTIGVERWLDTHAFKTENTGFGHAFRLALYSTLPPAPARTLQPVHVNFAQQLTLRSFALTTPTLPADGLLGITTHWQVNKAARHYVIAAHLTRDGQIWGQSDHQIAQGWLNSTQTSSGQDVTDLAGVQLLPGAPPGRYTLRVSVHLLEDPHNLSILDTAGNPQGQEWTLNTFEVSAATRPPVLNTLDIQHHEQYNLGVLRLLGYNVAPQVYQPGEHIPVTLFWQVQSRPQNLAPRLLLSLSRLGRYTGKPIRLVPAGGAPPSSWHAGDIYREQALIVAPPETPPGQQLYSLNLSTTDEANLNGSAMHSYVLSTPVLVNGHLHNTHLPSNLIAQTGTFGSHITLLGYQLPVALLQSGQSLTVILYWRSDAMLETNYTVFIHLLDPTGRLQAQQDSQPAGGALPFRGWSPGEVITDPHTLLIPSALASGNYHLEVGLYDSDTGQRLTLSSPAQGTSLLFPRELRRAAG